MRARLRSLDRLNVQLFCSKSQLLYPKFVCFNNFDKFSTILASIVCYEYHQSSDSYWYVPVYVSVGHVSYIFLKRSSMRVVLAAIACATAAFALPVTQSNVGYVAMESDAMLVRSGWSMKDSAAARRNLQLTFAVRQQNLDRLARTVLEVSDPTHPSYGGCGISRVTAPKS